MQLVEVKEVGALGRLGIPEFIRMLCDMQPGQKVGLYLDGKRLVILSHEGREEFRVCTICGGDNPTIPVRDSVVLCRQCAEDVEMGVERAKKRAAMIKAGL